MSNKLNQGELLKKLNYWFKNFNHTSMEYDKKHNQAYQQIKELIQKPGVTEERIKEKAIELINLVGYRITGEYARHHLISVQDFIRSLIKEMI